MVLSENNAGNSHLREEFDLSKIEARVDRVNVSGLLRTHNDYILKVARNLFKVTNFREVMIESLKAQSYLYELGIFKRVSIHIDISRGETASPNGYDVTFKGEEFPRMIGSVGTEVGQNEGSLNADITMPNLFGRGESISIHGAYNSQQTHDVQLKFWKSLFHTKFVDNRPQISLSIFRRLDRFNISRFQCNNVGLTADFACKTNAFVPLRHSIQYETSIREFSLTKKMVPMFIREHCGPKLASLIRYTVTFDERDNPILPKCGLLLKSNNEFCGLGGNISYISSSSHGELNLPLFKNLSVQVCGRLGIIRATKWTTTLPLSQLYYCGGPLTLRGFKHGGAGPIINDIHLGAHTYWSAGFHIWAPMPFPHIFKGMSNNLRTHLFYNLGNFNTFSIENVRTAAGLGLAYNLANRARIELNYCIPIHKYVGDNVQNGFQFGIGYEFV